jgi:hypothetical protein
MPEIPLERKVEKGKLAKLYLAQKKAHREKVLERSSINFRGVIDWLQHAAGEQDSGQIITLAMGWKAHLDEEQTAFFLSEIANACDRIRMNAGLEEMSDPLPPDQNVFLKCREILNDEL